MARRTDAELGRLVRRALKGLRIRPRRHYGYLPRAGILAPSDWLESDADFMKNNRDAAVALLEALAPKSRLKCMRESTEK